MNKFKINANIWERLNRNLFTHVYYDDTFPGYVDCMTGEIYDQDQLNKFISLYPGVMEHKSYEDYLNYMGEMTK